MKCIHGCMLPVRNFFPIMQPPTSSNRKFQPKNYNSPCFLRNSISSLFWEECQSISKKGVWTPLSPPKQFSLRWGEGKKEKKPNPYGLKLQFYWGEALAHKALAPCAVLEHSHLVIWIQAIQEHSLLSISHSPIRYPLETLLLMLSKPRYQTLS